MAESNSELILPSIITWAYLHTLIAKHDHGGGVNHPSILPFYVNVICIKVMT